MTGGFGFFAPRLDGFLTAEQMNRQPARLCTVRYQEERGVADESLVEAIEALRREVEQLQRQLAATRAWCLGLEEEQTRLGALLQAAGRTKGRT
jgi:Ribonuclease G/E